MAAITMPKCPACGDTLLADDPTCVSEGDVIWCDGENCGHEFFASIIDGLVMVGGSAIGGS